jgi:hypothetical protein
MKPQSRRNRQCTWWLLEEGAARGDALAKDDGNGDVDRFAAVLNVIDVAAISSHFYSFPFSFKHILPCLCFWI